MMYNKQEIQDAINSARTVKIQQDSRYPTNPSTIPVVSYLAILCRVAESYVTEKYPFDWYKDGEPGMCGEDDSGNTYWLIGKDPSASDTLWFRTTAKHYPHQVKDFKNCRLSRFEEHDQIQPKGTARQA